VRQTKPQIREGRRETQSTEGPTRTGHDKENEVRQTVHILATVRNVALLDATRLVFKTLRVGFPKARVLVYENGMDHFSRSEIQAEAASAGCEFLVRGAPNGWCGQRMSHDAWVEGLIQTSEEPFWICDTDMVFFEAVEGWYRLDSRTELAGRFEPEFLEEWTRTVHVARLHTCLMYINPQLLRIKMREWTGQFPGIWSTAQVHLVRQQFIPVRCHPWRTGEGVERPTAGRGSCVEWQNDSPLFYDTCAGLYQANIGQPFSEQQDGAFEHLHCGTYADLISPRLSLVDLASAHRAIYANPAAARGIKKQQDLYYAQRRVGANVAKLRPAHNRLAREPRKSTENTKEERTADAV